MTASPLSGTQPEPVPVRSIVEHARRAPSVQNTQPWRWRATDDGLELWADWSRHLEFSDPDGRNLMISCGAALHHTLVAARALGWTAVVDHLPDARKNHLLARVSLRPVRPLPADSGVWLRSIADRCTDRRRFTPWPVPEARLRRLTASAQHHGAEVLVLTDKPARHRLDLLIGRAMLTQEHDFRVREEQEHWLNRLGGERHPVERTDGILVIGTTSDGPMSWLNAGETLSALWLEATIQGFSVVPLSQVVEVEETRVALRHEVLLGRLEGQVVVRIGWQEIGRSDLDPTRRRSVEDLLGT